MDNIIGPAAPLARCHETSSPSAARPRPPANGTSHEQQAATASHDNVRFCRRAARPGQADGERELSAFSRRSTPHEVTALPDHRQQASNDASPRSGLADRFASLTRLRRRWRWRPALGAFDRTPLMLSPSPFGKTPAWFSNGEDRVRSSAESRSHLGHSRTAKQNDRVLRRFGKLLR